MAEVAKKPDKKESLGRLKSLGLTLPYQIPLLLPNAWDDLTSLVDRFGDLIPAAQSCAVVGRLVGTPEVRFGGAAPMLIGYIADPLGNKLGFNLFGDTREFQESLQSQPDRVILLGQMDIYDGRNWLKTPELVSETWIGRLRPRYSGKPGVIKAETVRERVLSRLNETIPLAGEFLARELAQFGDRARLAELAGYPGWSLESILFHAHLPRTIEHGQVAQQSLHRLAALGIISIASAGKETRVCTKSLDLPDWRVRAKAIPFPLTDEQEQAVMDALSDMSQGAPMHRIISGDVGTGKTAVFAIVAATVVDGGGTVACLLPNSVLATQIFDEITTWWPDLPVQLMTGATRTEELCGSMVVGTTAILFKELGDVDLVIVDELQKTSRAQREQMVGVNTHLLESTATCIPRSQALIRYGAIKVSRLTKNHTPKEIFTRIWQKNEWPDLFAQVKDTLANGDQVLLVYALREKGEEADPAERAPEAAVKKLDMKSATEVYEKWNQMFPGLVRLIHGQMASDEKDSALDDMRAGRANICVATTVIEVGVNLPKLRRVVVVNPERHGASTLHQIRGRVARNGGIGHMDMFIPLPVKAATRERLQVLVATSDGFEVADFDMRLRGIGDLSQSSNKQSGADMTFLFGRPVEIDILDEMIRTVGV